MKVDTKASSMHECRRLASTLEANLADVQAVVEHFHGSRAYAGLLAFSRTISCLSRAEFLKRLQTFLRENLHVEAQVVCSVGAGVEGTRQAMLRGASCDGCEEDERLIINLYGASLHGNLVPLVIFKDDDVELEGIINVVPSPGAESDDVRDEILHASSQVLALGFRNLKLAGRLVEICPERLRGRMREVLAKFRGDATRLSDDIVKILDPSGRAVRLESGKVKRNALTRLIRFLKTRVGIALMALAVFFGSGAASYLRLNPLNQPFNATAAGVGKIVLGIPYSAGKTALDDGLIRVMLDAQSRQKTHDWLKGDNPSKVDYEKVLRENGWKDPYLHHLGRALGLIP
jgi:hypothetical protein